MKPLHKKLIATALGAFVLLCAASCGRQNEDNADVAAPDVVYRTLADIKSDGRIRIGVFSDHAPFSSGNDGGSYSGFEIALCERIAKDLSVSVVYVDIDAKDRVESLQIGKLDMVVADFAESKTLLDDVDFCEPYMYSRMGICARSDSDVPSLDEWRISNDLIAVYGSNAYWYVRDNYSYINIDRQTTFDDAKKKLKKSNGVWISDAADIINYATRTDGYEIYADNIGDGASVAPAVTKNNTTLLTWVDAEIKSLKNNRFFDKNYDRYLASTYGEDFKYPLLYNTDMSAGEDGDDTEAPQQ